MKKLKRYLRYLIIYSPDILFLTGAAILFYNIFTPVNLEELVDMHFVSPHKTEYKTLGVMLIIIAVDVIVRRYLGNKKTKN
ncbi:MAG TPA: hypothetical protein PLH82_03360 [Candidatus Paceibacterota bacterium]|nr:hypothetical protein [Candidatus Paceibacterota bacterium]